MPRVWWYLKRLQQPHRPMGRAFLYLTARTALDVVSKIRMQMLSCKVSLKVASSLGNSHVSSIDRGMKLLQDQSFDISIVRDCNSIIVPPDTFQEGQLLSVVLVSKVRIMSKPERSC